MTHDVLGFTYPRKAQAVDGDRGAFWSRRAAHQRPVPSVTVLINPSIDIQIGRVDDTGRWVTGTESAGQDRTLAAMDGLRSFHDEGEPLWGADVRAVPGAQSVEIEVVSPSGSAYIAEFGAQVLSLLEEPAARIEVIMTDRVTAQDIIHSQGRVDDLFNQAEADREGCVLRATAVPGAAPASVQLPTTAEARDLAATVAAASLVENTTQLRAAISDTTAHARAGFANDKVCQVLTTNQPVLLIEPATDVIVGGSSSRLPAALGEGMQLVAALPSATEPNTQRLLTIRSRGSDLELLTHDGRVIASAAMPALSPQWKQAVRQTRSVLVVYGPYLGVRDWPSQPVMGDGERFTELHDSQRKKMVVWCRARIDENFAR